MIIVAQVEAVADQQFLIILGRLGDGLLYIIISLNTNPLYIYIVGDKLFVCTTKSFECDSRYNYIREEAVALVYRILLFHVN